MAASAMTVMLFPSCDKDDDGGSAGGFDVHVPSFVKGTTPIRVDLGVSCDKAPTVTFATEGDALGVVSPVENPEFDTDYVYAGEPIDASFVNGRATASFWYIPLTPGNHAVTFTVNYTQNGAAKTGTNRKVLKVSDASNGGSIRRLLVKLRVITFLLEMNLKSLNEVVIFTWLLFPSMAKPILSRLIS